MRTKHVWLWILLLVMGITTSCKNDDSEALSPVAALEKIVKTTEGIGEWEEAYITPQGYYLYRSGTTDENISRADEKEGYACLSFMSITEDKKLNLFLSKTDGLPIQAVSDEGTLYFSYPNDSILELVYDNGAEMIMQDSIPYSLNEMKDMVTSYKYEDNLQGILFYFTHLVEGHSSLPNINTIVEAFNKTLLLHIEISSDLTDLELRKNESGVYEFAAEITGTYETTIEEVYSVLTIWTGKATFKVGGTSCTLSGTIWYPSSDFNKYGEYGIVCDQDPNKLTLEDAEYKGTGIQTDKSYEVDFRGLKANTTYYYRAYYKFNTSDHGSLKFEDTTIDHGEVGYDSVTKEFTTGDNRLNVDVVMCMDVTGSMGGLIYTVKSNALSFYDIFNEACIASGIELSSLNTQVIAFRDSLEDGSRWLETSDTYAMPTQREEFNAFVESLYADGGGDTPESGLEALHKAFSKTDWGVDDGYHRQVVILWTDAPYLTTWSLEALEAQWNGMPSGRRLVLFAPNGLSGYNSGSWENLDGWKNVMHITDTAEGFENIDYVIEAIIGELTGKEKALLKKATLSKSTNFRPNK